MFKVATHSFQYYLDRVDQQAILTAYQNHENTYFRETFNHINRKTIV